MTFEKQTITLSGLRFYAYHGVEPQERTVGAWYTVNVEMEADVRGSMKSDSLAGSVNYAQAAKIIASVMETPCGLLERVAFVISQKLFTEFPKVSRLSVLVAKDNPPVYAPCLNASFSLTATRD